jgi:hypothetical protein
MSLCLLGCSHPSSSGGDAGTDVAGGDARLAGDALPGTVELTVVSRDRDGQPDAEAIAIFVDAAGATVYDGPVDDAGKLVLAFDGGDVTVIQNRDTLTTIRGVQAGDQLVVGAPHNPLRSFEPAAETMFAVFPQLPGQQLHFYYFLSTCADAHRDPGALDRVVVRFFPDCSPPTFDLLAFGDSSAYLWVPDIPRVPGGGSFTIPSTWSSMSAGALALTNVPAGLASIETARFTTLNGLAALDGAPHVITTPAASLTDFVPYAPGAGTGTIVQVVANHTTTSRVIHERHLQSLPVDTSIDLAEHPLPVIGSPITATATGASWPQTGTGTPDARIVRWSGSWTKPTANGITWFVVDDGGTGSSITLPMLPATHADVDPRAATDLMFVQASVELVDYDNLDGYAAARRNNATLGEEVWYLDAFATETYARTVSRGQ